MTQKFKLKHVNLLPPLDQTAVENIIKFIRYNGSGLFELANYESCCADDNTTVHMRYVCDSLRLGYGFLDLDKYIKDMAGEEEDE
jgi:hypothetical protein